MRPPKPEPPQVVYVGGARFDVWEALCWLLLAAALSAIIVVFNVYGERDATQHHQPQAAQSESGGLHISPMPIGPKLGNGLYLNPGWAP